MALSLLVQGIPVIDFHNDIYRHSSSNVLRSRITLQNITKGMKAIQVKVTSDEPVDLIVHLWAKPETLKWHKKVKYYDTDKIDFTMLLEDFPKNAKIIHMTIKED